MYDPYYDYDYCTAVTNHDHDHYDTRSYNNDYNHSAATNHRFAASRTARHHNHDPAADHT